MPNTKKETHTDKLIPDIISATGSQDGKGFYVKYKQGKKGWIAYEPYTEELYKRLIPYLPWALKKRPPSL